MIDKDETVVWSCNDYEKVGIYNSEQNSVTILGRNTGTTTVTATVKDKEENVIATYTWCYRWNGTECRKLPSYL